MDEEPIGITGIYSYHEYPENAWLGWFGILNQYRKRGYGGRVLDKTIELAKEKGYTMSSFASDAPEAGKDIGTYKSNRYMIPNTEEANFDADVVKLIFWDDDTLAAGYWLASSGACSNFYGGYADFDVRCCVSMGMFFSDVYRSNGTSKSAENAIRPVVELNPSVQMKYENEVVKLK